MPESNATDFRTPIYPQGALSGHPPSMDPTSTPSFRSPLRLRWIAADTDGGRMRSWVAYDGPWEIGDVTDHRQSLPSHAQPYRWSQRRAGRVGVATNGYEGGLRAAAFAVEVAYFTAMEAPEGFHGSIAEQIAFAEWAEIALPDRLTWAIAHLEGRNPFPLRPHRAQLQGWAEEDRKRGGRGMLTPAVMAAAFGPDWMGRMHG